MRKSSKIAVRCQRGASLFVVLLVCVAVISAALFGVPWLNNKRELARVEQMEADAMRGVPPARHPNQPSASSPARELPNELAADKRMRPEAVTPFAPPAHPAAAVAPPRNSADITVGEFLRGGLSFKSLIDPSAYNALSAPCKVLLDTVVGMLDNPEDSSSYREKLDAAERRFVDSCVDKEAEARAEAKRVADERAFVRRSECEEQRRVLAKYRNKVITDDTAPNKKQVDQLEAIIAANC